MGKSTGRLGDQAPPSHLTGQEPEGGRIAKAAVSQSEDRAAAPGLGWSVKRAVKRAPAGGAGTGNLACSPHAAGRGQDGPVPFSHTEGTE